MKHNFDDVLRCTTVSLFLLIIGQLELSRCLPVPAVDGIAIANITGDPTDGLENTAKLLIDIDRSIENALSRDTESPPALGQFYFSSQSVKTFAEPDATTADHYTGNGDRADKFSLVLQELSEIEQSIKEAISKTNANRQFRLVMRLRPLLSYVNHIHRNMEMFRTRVVAIGTLSNLSVSVNEVLGQFGDVMRQSTGSQIVTNVATSTGNMDQRPGQPPSGDVRSTAAPHSIAGVTTISTRTSTGISTIASASTTTISSTTYSDIVDSTSENFLQQIIN